MPFSPPSAYTEAYKVCLLAAAPQAASAGDVTGDTTGEEDAGRTSEEEEGADGNYDRQVGDARLGKAALMPHAHPSQLWREQRCCSRFRSVVER